ncbi:MAG: hypothetical protein AB7T31_00030 [Gemmatimonadales bacterium]
MKPAPPVTRIIAGPSARRASDEYGRRARTDEGTAPRGPSRRRTAYRRVGIFATVALACASGRDGHAQASPGVTYEYVYPYNTAGLTENHHIVLDTSLPGPRGWYYGTSDEFDVAREGYPPGFFVAPMSALELSSDAISFTLERPGVFFTTPVPLVYRDVAAIPDGLLEAWNVPLPIPARRYSGALGDEEIRLDVMGGTRVFRRAGRP